MKEYKMRLSDGQKNVILIISEFISLVVVCFAIYKTVLPLYETPMFLAEALYEPYWNANTSELDSSFSQIFLSNPHSWYILSVIQVLMQRYLPDTLNIHPVIFLENYYKFFLFGYFILFLSVLVKNFTKYFDKFYFSSLLIPFAAILFVCSIIDIPALWILVNPSWCTVYIFTTAIFLLFLLKTEYLFVNFQKPSKKDLFLTGFLFFCIAISHEMFKFILCFGILLLFFLCKIVFGFKFKKVHLLYLFLLFLTCLANSLSKSSLSWFSAQCPFSENFETVSVFQYIFEYFSGYFNFIILPNILFIISLIILCILLYFFVPDKEKNKRILLYIFTLISSVFAFFIAAIIGKEYDHFVFEHVGLRVVVSTIFIFAVFSVTGYLLKMTDNKILKKTMLFLIVISQITAFLNIPDLKKITLYDRFENRENKRITYMMEKLFVLYGKEHKKFYYINYGHYTESNIIYLLHRYDKNARRNNYENIEVCSVTELKEYLSCKNKFLKLIEEKTGDKNTQSEIKNPDFKVFDKYTVFGEVNENTRT